MSKRADQRREVHELQPLRVSSMGGHSASRVIVTLALTALCLASFSVSAQKQEQTQRNNSVIPKQIGVIHKTNSTQQIGEQNHQHLSSKTQPPPTTTTTSTTTVAITSPISSTSSIVDQQQQRGSKSPTKLTIESNLTITAPITTTVTKKQPDGNGKAQTNRKFAVKLDPTKSKLDDEKQHLAAKRSGNIRSQQNNNEPQRDPIDQMSTSQSVSFADPLSASTNNIQESKQAKGANRWTHFGARLKPLVSQSTRDHHEVAANSKSQASVVYRTNEDNANRNLNQQQQRVAASRPVTVVAASANNIDSDEDDLDDDQDSEALLYKLMQQQSFLMSPNWQEPSGNIQTAKLDSVTGASGNNQLVAGNQQQQPRVANSKRVIKLLKSYSHIHQVDDSDDQIRGTYTRLPARRLTGNSQWQQENGRSQQEQNYGNNRNRSPSASNYNKKQQLAPSKSVPHIFVSSQPLNQIYNSPAQGQLQPVQTSSSRPEVQVGGGESSMYKDYSSSDDNGSNQGGSGSEDDESGSAPPGEDDFECPNNGIFADEASGCQAYHVCQSGAQVQQKFQCPLGTLFNNIILTCDFAHNVQCGGKVRQTTTTVRPASFAPNEPIYRNPQEQVTPRGSYNGPQLLQQVQKASVQVDQGSYVRVQQQHSRKPYLQQGPRQLIIGSRYNKHQQPRQPVQAQAVSVYPKTQPLSTNELDDTDSDNEPATPLVPATLPPRLAAMTLPYNPPPPVTPNNQRPAANYQSSHRSQYPKQFAHSSYRPSQASSYDATSPTMTFVDQDEPANTTPASVRVSPQQQPERQQNSLTTTSDMQKSFDLVINHVAPIRQHTKANGHNIQEQVSVLSQSHNTNKKSLVGPTAKQNHLLEPVGLTASTNKRKDVKPSVAVSRQQNGFARSVAAQQQVASLSRNVEVLRESKQQMAQQQSAANSKQMRKVSPKESRRQEQRASLHQSFTEPQAHPQKQQESRGTLVDLTNDKQASVGSEALNDGLLLIVRHGSGSSPIQVGISSGQDRSLEDYSKQQHLSPKQKQQITSKAANTGQPATSGQAYAIDPNLVRPDSSLDAQLFPHVQKVLASQQVSQPTVSHQSAAKHQ